MRLRDSAQSKWLDDATNEQRHAGAPRQWWARLPARRGFGQPGLRIEADITRAIVVANNHFHGKALKLIEDLLAWYCEGDTWRGKPRRTCQAR